MHKRKKKSSRTHEDMYEVLHARDGCDLDPYGLFYYVVI